MKEPMLGCFIYKLNAARANTYDLFAYWYVDDSCPAYLWIYFHPHNEKHTDKDYETDFYVNFANDENNPAFINPGFSEQFRTVRTKDKKFLLIIKMLFNSIEVYVFSLKDGNYKKCLRNFLNNKYVKEMEYFKDNLTFYSSYVF